MIKLTWAGVNHIMVLGNVIQHQTQERPKQEAPTTMCVMREKAKFLQATLLRSAALRNMQQAGTQKWLRCVLLSPGCGERSAPAWSQDGGQGENHKVKIEAARARTCPAWIKERRDLGTQQSATMTDGGL